MAWATHEVFNQVPALQDYNLYGGDSALQEALAHAGGAWHEEALSRYGAQLGSAAAMRLGDDANRHEPELVSHDRLGNRVDQVVFHPAWAELMNLLYGEGVHCAPWAEPRQGAHAARAAAFMLHGQIEAGSLCPTTMTFAAIPLLMREPGLFAEIETKLFGRRYDGRDRPLADKHSATIGMGMTEKQGGSDLRSNTTTATAQAAGARGSGRGARYALVGHKWFMSAPTADVHLVLARADEGPSCFYVPRWRGDGTRNAVRIQRLKRKLGNASNASAEVELCDAEGIMVGEPGRGIATIIQVAARTRLDCVLGSAALMRQALVQALHHARYRSTFGRPLLVQPLMRTVLVDVALESEAATRLGLRLACACENEAGDALERALWRIVTPAAKFWVCKRAIAVAAECMEVLGGNGYVEETPLARLYREAPVNSIWEGSGNVMCLDVLRGLAREPELTAALFDFLSKRCAADRLLTAAVGELSDHVQARDSAEARGRWIAQRLAQLLQAVAMLDYGPPRLAEAFIYSRFGSQRSVFGSVAALPDEKTAETILQRAWMRN